MPDISQVGEGNSVNPINELIGELERLRRSKVIVYITGDRQLITGMPLPFNLTTQVAPDALPLISNILSLLTSSRRITLVIYTNGGLIETPWPLVNLIRERSDYFEVVVMKKALSAGTLIALGADSILMPRGSFLSPVDPARMLPSKDGPAPQQIPMPIQPPKQIEIEDIIGFIDFAKDKVGINDQSTLGEVLKELSKEIDPSTIGSINRTHSLIRRLAQKLLDLHVQKLPEHQKKELVEQLTEKLFSHTHLISSREAREIGFGDLIQSPNEATETVINNLYREYEGTMKLIEPLNLDKIANEDQRVKQGEAYSEDCITAVLHSKNIKYKVESKITIQGMPNPQGGQQINVNVINPGWVKED